MTGPEPLSQRLTALLGTRVQFKAPMNRHTYFKVGGPADILARPDNPEEMAEVIRLAELHGIPWRVIGDGTNLLVLDDGVRGLLMLLGRGFGTLRQHPSKSPYVRVTAGAGVKLPSLCRYATQNGLDGLTFAAGIPGTLGGAVMMNAGTPEGAMADVVESIRIMDRKGRLQEMPRDQLIFKYRRLSFRDPETDGQGVFPAVLEACLLFKRGDAELLKALVEKRLDARRKAQPMHQPSAGCFFKNPKTGMSAGELIDRVGMKGRRIGGAEVSTKHANYIVNRGDATATDILELARLIQSEVAARYAIDLEFEVQIVGS